MYVCIYIYIYIYTYCMTQHCNSYCMIVTGRRQGCGLRRLGGAGAQGLRPIYYIYIYTYINLSLSLSMYIKILYFRCLLVLFLLSV